jgi:1,4-dihydroxy-6-naphthoate synthase
MTLRLGISPCPNDTFVFHALVHQQVDTEGLRFDPVLDDVERLNGMAAGGSLDVVKVSYGAVPFLLGEYALLRSGGALGRGCGPLIVVRPGTDLLRLHTSRIAIPGLRTTANLLLRLWDPKLREGKELLYSEIMPAVARGDFAAGLIIHESRFTYPEHGLDLGEWWETVTGLPIPLGAILARRSLGRDRIRSVERAIRRSVEHALTNPIATDEFVARYAQEMRDEVRRSHIELYVNEFTRDLGRDGEHAVRELLARAVAAGLVPPTEDPLFGS